MPEGLVGLHDLIKPEMMLDQLRRIDLVRLHGLEQYGRGRGVDQPPGDGDVAIPEFLEMEIDLDPVHPDVGDDATRC